jgi:hypothetical protein
MPSVLTFLEPHYSSKQAVKALTFTITWPMMFMETGVTGIVGKKIRIYLAFMSSEADTKRTLETVLERVNYVATMMHEFQVAVEARLGMIERQLERMDIRLDRLEGEISKTRSEMMHLRADFKEFRSQFNQPA